MFEDVLIKADGFLVKNGFLTGKDNVLEWTKTSIENLSETSEVKKAKGALSSGKKKRSEK